MIRYWLHCSRRGWSMIHRTYYMRSTLPLLLLRLLMAWESWCLLLMIFLRFFKAKIMLLPSALLSPGLDGAPLTISASVWQLRWAFNGISLPESMTWPSAEAEWHRGMVCLIPERDWIASWSAVHKAPTSGKVRSFLWKLMHRRLSLLCYEHNANYYDRQDIFPLCTLSSENAIYLFVEI
jgi:hypothetical protein